MTDRNFNTSHVNVNQALIGIVARHRGDFNTSHVNVNQITTIMNIEFQVNFNTSHVNVNLLPSAFLLYPLQFQYISC